MKTNRCQRVAARVAAATGLVVSAVERGRVVRVQGAVPSELERAVVEEIARRAARGADLESALRVGCPCEPSEGDPADEATEPATAAPVRLLGSDAQDELRARAAADDLAEGAGPYFAPTDPVVTTDARGGFAVLGGFSPTSMDDLAVPASASDRRPGDEALASAVRRELREDAATTDLTVAVAVRRGVAYLDGRVAGPEDAENAEAVAARVPGVVEVVERLEVACL
jgi:osmotically-inducible protein OsmY